MTNATLSFISDLPLYTNVKPYAISTDTQVPEEARSNIKFEERSTIPITDVRTLPHDNLSYSQQGFRFFAHPSSATYEFGFDDASVATYCRKLVELVRKEFMTEHVFCYDLKVTSVALAVDKLFFDAPKVRDSETKTTEYGASTDLSAGNIAPPVYGVHIDHTETSGPQRIRRHLTNVEVERFLNGGFRARIVNANHKWYWLSFQTPEEVAVFVQYDSNEPRESDTVSS
ncbi:hypothetical protein EJ05DRAFT_488534 [Pseudovirgaria hyperparasitica]|uniref:Uncharacterized protein n=1 Tax=Pseudovirgaria hyperparasitica TaxID=470096 RepID=A0A6A6W066_9PEZI|nr:uncharacterized protein EJ05DRAFT_488534 [Pseudovirgaria hyperparasitica]KAF2754967.1 hypothetical protein EJ05DRAFT_488534 [Pseudovirgaria hyperparasitica]